MKKVAAKNVLIQQHGYYCFFGYDITDRNKLTFHHINKKCDGGRKTARNGAMITENPHCKIHFIEHASPVYWEQIKNYLLAYKQETDEEVKEMFRKLAKQDLERMCLEKGYSKRKR